LDLEGAHDVKRQMDEQEQAARKQQQLIKSARNANIHVAAKNNDAERIALIGNDASLCTHWLPETRSHVRCCLGQYASDKIDERNKVTLVFLIWNVNCFLYRTHGRLWGWQYSEGTWTLLKPCCIMGQIQTWSRKISISDMDGKLGDI